MKYQKSVTAALHNPLSHKRGSQPFPEIHGEIITGFLKSRAIVQILTHAPNIHPRIPCYENASSRISDTCAVGESSLLTTGIRLGLHGGHLNAVMNLAIEPLVIVYVLPFWHQVTPLFPAKGKSRVASRWLLLNSFEIAE